MGTRIRASLCTFSAGELLIDNATGRHQIS
jgi:hypothetical protein